MLPFPAASVPSACASSHSQRMTTRRAIYANTSDTPAPVLAEVKNSFGPRGGRRCIVRAVAYRAGVIVGAEDVDSIDVERERRALCA